MTISYWKVTRNFSNWHLLTLFLSIIYYSSVNILTHRCLFLPTLQKQKSCDYFCIHNLWLIDKLNLKVYTKFQMQETQGKNVYGLFAYLAYRGVFIERSVHSVIIEECYCRYKQGSHVIERILKWFPLVLYFSDASTKLGCDVARLRATTWLRRYAVLQGTSELWCNHLGLLYMFYTYKIYRNHKHV